MSTTTNTPAPAPAQGPAPTPAPAAPAPTPAPPAASATPGEQAPATPAAPAQETDWKAEARKWEARAKENAEARRRLDEIEAASKTEAQRLADELEQARAKVKQYETQQQIAEWKAQVAEATGVPVKALAGSTLEEIEAHAETLKALITPAAPPPAPVPGVSQTPPPPGNVSIDDQILTAEQAGDWALAKQLKAVKLGQLT